jgi:hypothetical protein
LFALFRNSDLRIFRRIYFFDIFCIYRINFFNAEEDQNHIPDAFFSEGDLINDWLTSLPEIQQNFKCPTIGFTYKQRQLYSNNGSLPFPVWQTVFSTPIETWVIFRVVAINDNQLSHIKWAYIITFGGASVWCVCVGGGGITYLSRIYNI